MNKHVERIQDRDNKHAIFSVTKYLNKEIVQKCLINLEVDE